MAMELSSSILGLLIRYVYRIFDTFPSQFYQIISTRMIMARSLSWRLLTHTASVLRGTRHGHNAMGNSK